jgi:hypothetical protein
MAMVAGAAGAPGRRELANESRIDDPIFYRPYWHVDRPAASGCKRREELVSRSGMGGAGRAVRTEVLPSA